MTGALQLYPKAKDVAQRQAANQDVMRAQKETANALNELSLFGPSNVFTIASNLYDYLETNAKKARSGADNWSTNYDVINKLLEQIYEAMRVDLESPLA